MTQEINEAVAKALYGDNLVFHHHGSDSFMATSQERLEESLEYYQGILLGWDNIRVGEPESFCVILPDYSGKIVQAWPLVKRITEKTKFYMTNRYAEEGTNKWDALYMNSNDFWTSAEAETAPEAICLLFLKFKGVAFERIKK